MCSAFPPRNVTGRCARRLHWSFTGRAKSRCAAETRLMKRRFAVSSAKMTSSVSLLRRIASLPAILILIGALASPAVALDLNGNGLSDIWELVYGAGALTAGGDANGDGMTNAQANAAGVNPFAANSRPALILAPWTPGQFQLGYARVAGKRYRIESKTDLSLPLWTTEFTEVAQSSDAVAYLFPMPAGTKFWRLEIDDVDSDGDGLTDAEERWLAFNPIRRSRQRSSSDDGRSAR